MLKIRDTIQSLKGVVLGLVVVLGVSVASAGTYTGPSQAAPGGNADAPINVGSSLQVKNGSLGVNAFTALQNAYFAQNVGIGDTSNDGTLKLDVEGDTGSTRYCDQNGANCFTASQLVTIINNNTSSGVPSGAVMAFTGACPSGWADYTQAQGRYIVGGTSSLGTTVGTALGNLENREVGMHNHGINDPGHRHIYDKYGADGPGGNGGDELDVDKRSGVLTSLNYTGISIKQAGTINGTNAPYVQLRYCVKS